MKIETPKTQFEDKHLKNGLMVLFVKELMLSNCVKNLLWNFTLEEPLWEVNDYVNKLSFNESWSIY